MWPIHSFCVSGHAKAAIFEIGDLKKDSSVDTYIPKLDTCILFYWRNCIDGLFLSVACDLAFALQVNSRRHRTAESW